MSRPSRIRFGSAGEPDYTADEIEFLRAMERYRRERRRPFPTCCEVLAILRSLGYRRVSTYYEVWGVEKGERQPPYPICKIPAAQWSDELEERVLRELEQDGATQLQIKIVEQWP